MDALRHSDVRSKQHHVDKERNKLMRLRPVRNPLYLPPPVEPVPDFLEGRDLRVEGHTSWIVNGGTIEPVSGDVMIDQLSKFIHEVDSNGGCFRKSGVKAKNGEEYLKPAETMKPLERITVHLPLWLSKAWSELPGSLRVKAKSQVMDVFYAHVKERWPKANLKALSLHDDTGNLHVDVWATELEKVSTITHGKSVTRYVTKGQVFNSGCCGVGTIILQNKVDAGHQLHPADLEKLNQSLKLYELHRAKCKKKVLPEIPEEISFARALDAAFSEMLAPVPSKLSRYKEAYLEHCKAIDKVKYAAYNELVSSKSILEEAKLMKSKVLEEAKLMKARAFEEVQSRRAKMLEEMAEMETDLLDREKEISKNEADVNAWLESVHVSDLPARKELAELWVSSKGCRNEISRDQDRCRKLVRLFKGDEHPVVKRARKEILEFLEKNSMDVTDGLFK